MSGDNSEEKQFAIVADARRRWTREQKQSIVAECEAGKASVSAVARKHNIASSLLFRWRREFGLGGQVVRETPAFVPVALPAPASGAGARDGQGSVIEIELIGGRRVRVDGSIDASALRRVLEVLEGR
ncbi:MAG: IS66-like element accessory protein TnpA [Betaproteobacteria bacterium]